MPITQTTCPLCDVAIVKDGAEFPYAVAAWAAHVRQTHGLDWNPGIGDDGRIVLRRREA